MAVTPHTYLDGGGTSRPSLVITKAGTLVVCHLIARRGWMHTTIMPSGVSRHHNLFWRDLALARTRVPT